MLYNVTAYFSGAITFEVEADDRKKAIEKADELFEYADDRDVVWAINSVEFEAKEIV